MKKRVLVVFGTRPEAIKMAPVVRRLSEHPAFQPAVAVTAQHRELLDDVLGLFGIVPDHDLDIMEHGQTIADITCRALRGIDRILAGEDYDALLVHGDTTTTLAAALAGFNRRVPVGHVEAGMRTGNLSCPFPEEANRSMVARIAEWHFPPSQTCEENLLREGVSPLRIHRTSHNTVIDALRSVSQLAYEFPVGAVADALHSDRRLVLVTCHRRESWGRGMRDIFTAIRRLSETINDVHFLVATHPNRVVSEAATEILGQLQHVDLIGPQGYLPFVKLMSASNLILSDSGGIQEEGPAVGTPVLVLRDVTEYPELVARGAISLVGTSEQTIFDSVSRVLRGREVLRNMTAACESAYAGDDAVTPIVEALLDE